MGKYWVFFIGFFLCQMDGHGTGFNIQKLLGDQNVGSVEKIPASGLFNVANFEPTPINNGQTSYVFKAASFKPTPIDKDRLGDEDYLKSMTTATLRPMKDPFSSGVLQLKYLVHLHLNFCEIEVLPEEIGDLTALQFLDLSSNFLKQLPQSFAQLTALEHLDLSCNQLQSPPDLTTLSNLSVFRLQHFQWRDHQELKINTNKLKYLDLCFLTTGLDNFDGVVYPFLWDLVLKDIDVYWWVNVQPHATILTKNNMERNFEEGGGKESYDFIQNLQYPKMNPGGASGDEFICYAHCGFAKLDEAIVNLDAVTRIYKAIVNVGVRLGEKTIDQIKQQN